MLTNREMADRIDFGGRVAILGHTLNSLATRAPIFRSVSVVLHGGTELFPVMARHFSTAVYGRLSVYIRT